MMRKWPLFIVVLMLSFGVVVALGSQRSSTGSATRAGDTPRPDPGERTTTGDGRVSFTAPKGWTTGPCPPRGDANCVRLSPRGAAEGDAVIVMANERNQVEGSPMDLLLADDAFLGAQSPSIERLTLDGAKVARMDLSALPTPAGPPGDSAADADPWSSGLPGVQDVLVVGVLPVGTHSLLVTCGHGRLVAEMRAGCDLIVESLRFPR
ncbi:hypothetical protein O7614_09210 [Micromonospora sp. WMMD961]|uniref:hypothetical protein n=1 Tax=Micromonospora sp. WMMD961 TaxID=3016100 RepID=UPI0024163171|nr:hypothetical protein [Micromonospora sp. WMMD961]MDG4779819.1 hypothetical protein [Micromonospora sp. WMMD961]